MDEVQSNVVGPGSIVEQSLDVKPALEGATEFEYVEVFNPLMNDFAAQFATSTPVNAPLSIGRNTAGIKEEDLRQSGIDLRNPDYQTNGRSQRHITTTTLIKAGQTKRFPGDKAQIVVRQLVTEILQQQGQKLQMWNPHARQEVENQVIRARGSIQEMLDGGSIRSVSEQVNDAFTEQEFPEVAKNEGAESRPTNSQKTTGSTDSREEAIRSQHRTSSRPRRTQ